MIAEVSFVLVALAAWGVCALLAVLLFEEAASIYGQTRVTPSPFGIAFAVMAGPIAAMLGLILLASVWCMTRNRGGK